MVSHIPPGVIYRAPAPRFGAETAQSAPQSLKTHSRAQAGLSRAAKPSAPLGLTKEGVVPGFSLPLRQCHPSA